MLPFLSCLGIVELAGASLHIPRDSLIREGSEPTTALLEHLPREETGLAQPAKWKVKATSGGVNATGILEEHILINLLCQIKSACGSCVAAAYCCDSSPICFNLPSSSVVI